MTMYKNKIQTTYKVRTKSTIVVPLPPIVLHQNICYRSNASWFHEFPPYIYIYAAWLINSSIS